MIHSNITFINTSSNATFHSVGLLQRRVESKSGMFLFHGHILAMDTFGYAWFRGCRIDVRKIARDNGCRDWLVHMHVRQ